VPCAQSAPGQFIEQIQCAVRAATEASVMRDVDEVADLVERCVVVELRDRALAELLQSL
jgi:hypothetical protein